MMQPYQQRQNYLVVQEQQDATALLDSLAELFKGDTLQVIRWNDKQGQIN